jgi:ribosomal protein S6--L-glutamate ligase
MEVNSSPGLEGIERSTGKDIAGDIIRIDREECGLGQDADPG